MKLIILIWWWDVCQYELILTRLILLWCLVHWCLMGANFTGACLISAHSTGPHLLMLALCLCSLNLYFLHKCLHNRYWCCCIVFVSWIDDGSISICSVAALSIYVGALCIWCLLYFYSLYKCSVHWLLTKLVLCDFSTNFNDTHSICAHALTVHSFSAPHFIVAHSVGAVWIWYLLYWLSLHWFLTLWVLTPGVLTPLVLRSISYSIITYSVGSFSIDLHFICALLYWCSLHWCCGQSLYIPYSASAYSRGLTSLVFLTS